MQLEAGLDEIICSHPFLAGLPRPFFGFLEPCASIRRFNLRQRIFEEGTGAEHFYLINSGQVALETRVAEQASLRIQTLGAGDPLGWSWLFPPYQWCLSAVTLTPAEVICFGAGFLRERAEEDLEFGNELLKRVGTTMIVCLQAMRQALVGSVHWRVAGIDIHA